MKKYLFAVAIVVLIVAASGCTSQTGNNTSTSIPTKNYNGSGISFDYPDIWTLNATNNSAINAVVVTLMDSDYNSTNATKGNYAMVAKLPTASINIGTLKSQFLSSVKDVNGTGTESSITINGITGNQTTYSAKNGTEQAQARIITFDKNSFTYIMMFISFNLDPASQQQYFDVITKSFKAT